MPTQSEMASTYQSAVDALLAVKLDVFSANAEQREAATEALDELNRTWISDVQARYQERTKALNVLVERLQGVSNSIQSNALQTAKNKLNAAIERARTMLHETAREALSGDQDQGPEDLNAVEPVTVPRDGKERTSPPAADSDTSTALAVPPQRPSLAAPSPSAARRRFSSAVREDLYDDYARLFEACLVRPEAVADVNGHVQKVIEGRERYEVVSDPLGIPWWFVGVIHGLETGYRFNRHLHNGDPLGAPTVHVPKDRPPGWAAVADKRWELSARDALISKELDQWSDWSVPGTLYQWERYNGFGYRKYHPEVLSPYLWSFTNHYTKGKYVADGRFDSGAVSTQCGAVATLRVLVNKGVVVIS